jgi:hypothetical protein
MVMDFEDGMSLSKLLKDGKRWNEASLTGMFKPIAEGLDRAHRVGVLHRDIKPPNILITDGQRPVLIDFGSARFESGEATSTSVTFHTPPYAAIEQYVRTYDQGPWTDIYALGVVLYQCITGDKPPEVLERMHAGLGKPLAEGDWPGYSKKFLQAVDAAMVVKPTERPQSISKWLGMFDKTQAPAVVKTPEPEAEVDADATVVGSYEPEQIVPVAPPPPGFSKSDKVETSVPKDTTEVKFKRAGEDTQAKKKAEQPGEEPVAEEELPDEAPAELEPEIASPPKPRKVKRQALDPRRDEEPSEPAPAPELEAPKPVEPAPADAVIAKAPAEAKKPADTKKKSDAVPGKKLSPVMIGGAAVALAILGVGGWYLSSGSGGDDTDEELAVVEGVVADPIDIEASGGIAPAVQALADEASGARVSAASLKVLTDAVEQLTTLDEGLKRMAADPAQADAAKARQSEMERLAMKASADFAGTLLREADGRVRRLASDLPWADPRNAGAAAAQSPQHQNAARQVRLALSGLRNSASEAGAAEDAATALTAAQQALAQSGAYNFAVARAYRVSASPAAAASEGVEVAPTAAATVAGPAADAGPKGQASELFPAKFRNFNAIIREARSLSDDVVELGRGAEPASDASQDVKDGYRIRQQNANTARATYVPYLDTLVNSMRGDRTEGEVDVNISRAEETRRYLRQLLESSRATRR